MYDAIIVGGGLAGLSLAYELVSRLPANSTILIIDKNKTWGESHTWSFWTDRPTILDPIVKHRWCSVQTISDTLITTDLQSYQFQFLEGKNIFSFLRSALLNSGKVFFSYAEVTQVREKNNAVLVSDVLGNKHHGRFAFDSRVTSVNPDAQKNSSISGCGYEILAKTESFDPDVMTFFDGRVPTTDGAVHFAYVLPFTKKRALIDLTTIGTVCSKDSTEQLLHHYLRTTLGITSYQLIRRESDKPALLTTKSIRRQPSLHVIKIGLAAGLLKPSSGFALTRILEDSSKLASQLAEENRITIGRSFSARLSSVFDAGFLWLLWNRSQVFKSMLASFFSAVPLEKTVALLDESLSLRDMMGICSTMDGRQLMRIINNQ